MKRSLVLLLLLAAMGLLGLPLACIGSLPAIPASAVPAKTPTPCGSCATPQYTQVKQFGSSLSEPAGIMFLDNMIFVANYDGNNIQKYSADGIFLEQKGNTTANPDALDGPWGLGSGEGSNIYEADYYGGRIQKFSGDGQLLTSFPFSYAEGVVVNDKLGRIYALNYDNDTVYVYDMNFNYVAQFGSIFLSGPYNISIDSKGNIYVADYDNGDIIWFDPTNYNYVNNFYTDGGCPTDVKVDANGYIYETDECGSDVEKYDSNGNFIASIGSFNEPEGLTLDPSGNIYVADYGANQIDKFAPIN